MTTTEFDDDLFGESGESRKAEGIAAVKSSHSAWFQLAREAAVAWLAPLVGERVTGEDVTERVVETIGPPIRDNGEPGHHNVFGSLTSRLIRDGHLRDINEKVALRKPTSNARKTAVYIVERAPS